MNERETLDKVPTGLFIGGEWRDASDGSTTEVEDPATGETLTRVASATAADGKAALDAAVAAQHDWAATAPRERAEILRSAFDLMPTATADDWSVIATRLAAVPDALRGYTETLRAGIAAGVTPARRQVVEVATQIDRYTADDGFFAAFVAEAAPQEGNLPASLARTLADNSAAARVAYDELRSFLQGLLRLVDFPLRAELEEAIAAS